MELKVWGSLQEVCLVGVGRSNRIRNQKHVVNRDHGRTK